MLTVDELCRRINKAKNTIFYHIYRDETFRKSYFRKEDVVFHNMRGFDYTQKVYVCDEKDVEKIVEYLENKPRDVNKWSDLAIHCYKRNMICQGCLFARYCGRYFEPPMKKVVLENMRKYGKPKEEEYE